MLLALMAVGALAALRPPGADAATACPNATEFNASAFNWAAVYSVRWQLSTPGASVRAGELERWTQA